MKFGETATRFNAREMQHLQFEKKQLTNLSGLNVFHPMFLALNLKDRLRGCLRHLAVTPIFRFARIVLLLIFHLLLCKGERSYYAPCSAPSPGPVRSSPAIIGQAMSTIPTGAMAVILACIERVRAQLPGVQVEGYELKVVVTNKSLEPGDLLGFHKGRGAEEGLLAELKSHSHLDYVPARASYATPR